MIRCDALVVGGGPGGSTCARLLRKAGWDVVVADRTRFPRDKVCAGWLTPQVFPLLELEPAEYRATGLTLQEITGFRTGVLGRALLETRYRRVVSYAIRRCEFDDFLLRRARVRVLDGTAIASLRPSADGWVANDRIQTRVVVGAGGHFCPVARHLAGGGDTSRPVVAKEAEFRLPPNGAAAAAQTPELFFCPDMDGYAWYVRKGEYLNVGIGRRDSADFNRHVEEFAAFLATTRGVRELPAQRWHGHAYFASGIGPRPVAGDGMILVGDAAGLAYPESGEGIRPAIESGRLAAEALLAAPGRWTAADLQPYAAALRARFPPAARPSPRMRSAAARLGRVLLGSSVFTRHVVLNRWFLRT